MPPRRSWKAARAKVALEGRCRACGTPHGLQAAHVVPRSRLRADEGAEDPRNILPLCVMCHQAQHAGRLELLPLMSLEEQSYVAGLVGIEEARLRTTNRREAA